MLSRYPKPERQRGVVLLLSLIVLAAMSLAAIGLMRSVLISNRVAGNLAFQQSATQSADVGLETAIAWLEQKARELEET
ncbi:MAG TPA: PilX N-terminal domain-containing pilus assembly protein, partial [Roseateles sp.]|nr:PilX N-terminal domain-containing pilus assembly protein [Roseateles sp.]